MSYTVRPISDRTRFKGKHAPSPFGAPWSDTEQLLESELRHLRARNVVLELDFLEGQIRNGGRPYARAMAASSAVRLAFDCSHGPLVYATDRFPTWQDNVRAIALALNAFRRIDRYAVTEHGEQYAGFKALPAGRAMPASHMTTDEAWGIFGSFSDVPISVARRDAGNHPAVLVALRRKARAFAHPDRHGGDRKLWDQVEQAAAVLGVTS